MKTSKKCRLLSLLLAIVMVAGMAPLWAVPAVAAEEAANKAIVVATTDHLKGKQATNVYYGKFNGAPVKWRNLQNQNGELYLLSDRVLTHAQYSDSFENFGDPLQWCKSLLRDWLNGPFYATSFSDVERKAISTQNLKNVDNPKDGTDGGRDTKDNIFLLSYSDLGNTKLFENSNPFAADESRVAYDLDGFNTTYWLRTPGVFDDGLSGTADRRMMCVYGDGSAPDRGRYVITNYGIRPAFYLKTSNIFLSSAAKGGKQCGAVGPDSLRAVKDYTGNDWKLTLYDPQRTDFTVREKSIVAQRGEKYNINFAGAKLGENEFVSAMILDTATREPLYYGRIANNQKAGKAEIRIPADLPVGQYSLLVFSEQGNGNYKTDYMSVPAAIPLYVVANSDSLLYSIGVNVTNPVAGQTPKTGTGSATIENAKYVPVVSATVTAWYESDANGELSRKMSSTDKFRDGYTYYADIQLVRKTTSVFFQNSARGYASGCASSDKLSGDATYIKFRAKYTNLDKAIHSVDVEVRTPISGFDPSYNDVYINESNANYTATVAEWIEYVDEDDAGEYLPDSRPFDKNCTYEVVIKLTPKPGYSIAQFCKYTVNGREAKYYERNTTTGEVYCYLAMNCYPHWELNTVRVTGVTFPVAGQEASYKFQIAEKEAFCRSYLYFNEYNKDGDFIKAYSENSTEKLIFKPDYIYEVGVYLECLYNRNYFYFPKDCTVSIKGINTQKDDDYNYGSFTLYCGKMAGPISEIDIEMTPVHAGHNTDDTVVTSKTSGCTAQLTGVNSGPITEVDYFYSSADRYYSNEAYIFKIEITPNNYRTIAPDAIVRVNGVLADKTELTKDGVLNCYIVYNMRQVHSGLVANVVLPTHDNLPDGEAKSEYDWYTTKVVAWYKGGTMATPGRKMEKGETFVKGETYYVDIAFEADWENALGELGRATINGVKSGPYVDRYLVDRICDEYAYVYRMNFVARENDPSQDVGYYVPYDPDWNADPYSEGDDGRLQYEVQHPVLKNK